MARKFNVGRQGEQLLNEEWHALFMSLKYLNYDRYRSISEPRPERQTDIPERALRILSDKDIDFLETYYPNLGKGEWKPLFEGYYHPATATTNIGERPPAPYQLGIDMEDGCIKYWDVTLNQWITAKAVPDYYAVDTYNGLNFQFISELSKATKPDGTPLDYYPVPYVKYGRLFSKQEDKGSGIVKEDGTIEYIERYGRYLNAESNSGYGYAAVNECAIITDEENLSWVHVNASKVTSIEKRILKIQKDKNKPNYGYIRISSAQTEFYGFIAGNRQGTLLLRDKDFIDVIGGIELMMPTDYDYIYCMTYTFDDFPSNEGYVLMNSDTVGENNQVYVGQSECPIALFMDGLALEQTDEIGNEIYLHDEKEGVITFTDDEDADIIRNMQMTTVAFPKRTPEFTLSWNAANVEIDEAKEQVSVVINGNNINDYEHPMVFCSGLGLQETEIFEDVIIDGNKITIKGLIMPNDEPIKGFVADIKDSYMSKGQLDLGRIYDSNIKEGTEYIVFINGLLMTPTNGDMIVSNGMIEIINAATPDFGVMDYVLLEIEDDNDNKLGIVFDDTVSYYSVRIDDYGRKAVYNDCNSATVYVGNGIIIDQAAVERPVNSIEGYYKSGQIIKSMDDYGNGKYYIFDFADEEAKELTREYQTVFGYDEKGNEIIKNGEQIADEIEHLIGYYSTTGSIHLLGDDDAWTNELISYYAYSFANMIDEPMEDGRKKNLVIPPTANKGELITYNGQSSRMNVWNENCAALSTYINGLIIENEEIDVDGDGVIRDYNITYPKFYVPTDHDYYGTDADIIKILNDLYKTFKGSTEAQLRRVDINNETFGPLNEPISKYFASNQLFIDAYRLGEYINVNMMNESTSIVVERIERDEFLSAYRDFIYLETNKQDTDHVQIYGAANDTVEVDWALAPATVHVYLNGVLLENQDYCKFSNNKVMFNVDVCGIQQLPKNKVVCLPDFLSDKDRKEIESLYELKPKQIIRIIEDKPYYIPTSSRDTILIEKRNDTSIKSVTFDVLVTSYSTYEFNQDFYDVPESLVNTGDLIKIYINGVRYEGEYKIVRYGGVKGIKLMETGALNMDPLYQHFLRFPAELEKYKAMYQKDYERQIDRITFEWR